MTTSCHKAIMVITERAHCFHDFIASIVFKDFINIIYMNYYVQRREQKDRRTESLTGMLHVQ